MPVKHLFASGLALLRRERRCLVCTSVYRVENDGGIEAILCPECRSGLPRRAAGFCPDCGEPAAWASLPPVPCARCLAAAPEWDGFFFHGLYTGLLRRLLIRLKFQEQTVTAHVLGTLLSLHPDLRLLRPDAVVPVPLHKERLRRRGYNQALELARPLAAALQAPLLPGLLARTRATPPQTGFARKERRLNIRGAFAASPEVQGKNLLLVDDVSTTGATLEAAAAALHKAGAARIYVTAAARAGLHGFGPSEKPKY